MKKVTFTSLVLSALVATSAFAYEAEIDFNSLVPADQYSVSEYDESEFTDIDASIRRDRYECFAVNRRGRRFRAEGMNPRITQLRAIQECNQRSPGNSCRPVGCHRN